MRGEEEGGGRREEEGGGGRGREEGGGGRGREEGGGGGGGGRKRREDDERGGGDRNKGRIDERRLKTVKGATTCLSARGLCNVILEILAAIYIYIVFKVFQYKLKP